MSMVASTVRLLVGSALLVAALAAGLHLALRPQVAEPAQRVLQAIASGIETDREEDPILPVASLAGIRRGLPVFLLDGTYESRPVAHVLDHGTGPRGPWVHLRFEPGEDSTGPWSLVSHPPRRKLRAALEMTVPPDEARRFGRIVADRLEVLWSEVFLPDLEEGMPAFFGRIDPTEDTEAREVMRSLTTSVMRELDPLLDELGHYVARAMRKKFDLLDRLGLLVKVVGGDSKGLSRKLLPVAKQATRTWWGMNEKRVLKALGSAFGDEMPAIRDWVTGELFDAARDELARPILERRRKRLEEEGEAILRAAADTFVRAPEGGFRVRFAAMLRTQLLNKKTALLLLERPAPPR